MGEEADDEAEIFSKNLSGLSLHLNWPDVTSRSIACTDSDFSTLSASDSQSLPWYEGNHPAPSTVNQPSIIDTSKWTKIDIAGFEH